MSKGVVPHPKSYHKVGVEEWMNTVESLCRGFQDTTRTYASQLEVSNQEETLYAAYADADHLLKRISEIEQMIKTAGKSGPGLANYLLLPSSREECHRFGLWQQTRQVFRMNPNLADAVTIDSSCSVPCELFEKMPYPVVYLQLLDDHAAEIQSLELDEENNLHGRRTIEKRKIDGVLIRYDAPFLMLDEFSKYRLTSDTGETLIEPQPIYNRIAYKFDLSKNKTLGEIISSYTEERMNDERLLDAIATAKKTASKETSFPVPSDEEFELARQTADGSIRLVTDFLSKTLGSLIYICSTNADMEPMYVPSQSRKRSRGKEETQATVTAVGYREGLALGQARARHEREVAEIESEAPAGTHRSPAPHWRRGYFGHRWCGSGEDRHLEVRWVSPAAVGFKRDARNEVVTFHAVEPPVSELQEEVR